MLESLPPNAAANVREVLAAPEMSYDELCALLMPAFEAVAYPEWDAAVPEPAALTTAQRALATLLAGRSQLPVNHLAMPVDSWNRRRWLGLEPPGPLEELEGGRPRWRLLAETEDEEARTALLCRLPLPARVRAIAELSVGAYRLGDGLGDAEEWVAAACSLDDIDGSGAAWAPALADWLVALLDGPDWHDNRGALPLLPRWLVFTALVRAGVAIVPRWDRLLPVRGDAELPAALTCIRALPAERQVPAIAAALPGLFPGEGAEVVLELLKVMPSPALVDLFAQLIAEGGTRPPQALRADLAEAAREVPALAAVLAGRPAEAAPRALRLRALKRPPLAKLPRLARKQLGRLASERAWKFVELFAIDDEQGEHVYDMHLYSLDDGGVFAAGTANRVAGFSQGSADTADAELREALDLAVYNHRTAAKAKPKKQPAAKAKAKKPAAKAKAKRPKR